MRVYGNGDLGVNAGRVRNDEAQFEAVRKDGEAFARGEQYALGDARVAEPVGEAAAGGGVEIGVEVHAPHAEACRAIFSEEESAGVFVAFAGLDGFDGLDAGVAELGEERFDDVVLDPEGPAVGDEVAELAADELPVVVEGAGFRAGGLGQERQAVELGLEIELHEGLRKGGPGEGAIGCEVEGHLLQTAMPEGSQTVTSRLPACLR